MMFKVTNPIYLFCMILRLATEADSWRAHNLIEIENILISFVR